MRLTHYELGEQESETFRSDPQRRSNCPTEMSHLYLEDISASLDLSLCPLKRLRPKRANLLLSRLLRSESLRRQCPCALAFANNLNHSLSVRQPTFERPRILPLSESTQQNNDPGTKHQIAEEQTLEPAEHRL